MKPKIGEARDIYRQAHHRTCLGDIILVDAHEHPRRALDLNSR